MTHEKVIKGLECCKWDDTSLCKQCPYYYTSDGNKNVNCVTEMCIDTLEFLKEITEEYEKVKTIRNEIIKSITTGARAETIINIWGRMKVTTQELTQNNGYIKAVVLNTEIDYVLSTMLKELDK